MILVGGIAQSDAGWKAWRAQLDRLGVPSVIARVPGSGFATRAQYIAAIEDARRAVLEQAGLPTSAPVSIVGFSAGGVAAVSYLRLHPELVMRAVAVSSPLRGNWLASTASFLLGRLAPRWVFDLSDEAAVTNGITPTLATRITSVVGAPFDGIITGSSSTVTGITNLHPTNVAPHPAMQTGVEEVRHLALAAALAGTSAMHATPSRRSRTRARRAAGRTH